MEVNFTFEHHGTLITNPFLDETGRFSVNPLEYYGIKTGLDGEPSEDQELMLEVFINGGAILVNWDGFNEILRSLV